nr:IS6 family transposase [Streptomyces sp. CBMA123]
MYFRFPLSFREAEELMLERGVIVSYESVRRWCLKFGQSYANALRRRHPRPGDKWHLDEVFVKINGERKYLWRAVDADGNVLDILVQSRRDTAAARRFFKKLMKRTRSVPRVGALRRRELRADRGGTARRRRLRGKRAAPASQREGEGARPGAVGCAAEAGRALGGPPRLRPALVDGLLRLQSPAGGLTLTPSGTGSSSPRPAVLRCLSTPISPLPRGIEVRFVCPEPRAEVEFLELTPTGRLRRRVRRGLRE